MKKGSTQETASITIGLERTKEPSEDPLKWLSGFVVISRLLDLRWSLGLLRLPHHPPPRNHYILVRPLERHRVWRAAANQVLAGSPLFLGVQGRSRTRRVPTRRRWKRLANHDPNSSCLSALQHRPHCRR